MFEVLMPVDDSEARGAAQAGAVTAFPDSESVRATLLHVFGDTDRSRETSPRQVPGGRAAYEQLTAAGVAVEQETRAGEPATEILAAAAERDVDHVVMGGRKRSPARSLLFGSVTQTVLLEADRPVSVTGSAD